MGILTLVLIFQIIAGLFAPVIIPKPFDKSLTAYAGWYSTGGTWSYRKSITVDHTKVSISDQANFPIAISFVDPSLKTVANGGNVQNTNGFDIIFTSSDGSTKLDHEIEKYVAATGEVEMWVKIPTLSASVDTTVYMYFGNSGISTTQENKTGVWNDGGSNYFKGVWHMNQNPGGTAPQMTDSTQYSNNGTTGGTMTSGNQVAGQIDGATSFDGSDDYAVKSAATSLPTSAATVSMWIKTASNNYSQYGKQAFSIPKDSAAANGFDLNFGYGSGNKIRGVVTTNGTSMAPEFTSASYYNGNWHNFSLTYNGSVSILYLDGTSVATANGSGTISTDSNEINIGRFGSYGNNFNGSIDEIQLSSTARSADWIKTEYNNQSAPGSFYTLGAKENLFAASTHYWDYKKNITVTNNVASALTGYQVKLTLDTGVLVAAGKMQSTCADMRFVETDGNSAPYWIESGCNTASTVVWIKTNLSSSAAKTIYFYYGNSDATDMSDGNSTFDFFDSFDGVSVDATKWQNGTNPATYSQSSGQLNLSGKDVNWDTFGSLSPFADNSIIETKLDYLYTTTYGLRWGIGAAYGVGAETKFSYLDPKSNYKGYLDVTYHDAAFSCNAVPNIYGFQIRSGRVWVSKDYGAAVDTGYSPTYKYLVFMLTNDSGAGQFKFDWVHSRKYAATEPTISVGSEVNPNILLSGYLYRKPIIVTNQVVQALIGYQVKLTLDTAALYSAGKMKIDGSDLFFTDDNGFDIPYWIESGINTSSTIIWIKTDLASSEAKTVYMYYGNAGASALSNGNSVFDFFDDFLGSAIDVTKWDVSGTGTTTVSGGVLTTAGTSSWRYVKSIATFGTNYALRSRLKTAHSGSASYHERLLLSNGSTGGIEAWYSNSPAFRSYNGGSATGTISGWSADTYAIQDMIRDSSTSVIFRVNDANQVTLSSSIYTGSDSKINFNTAVAGSSMSADWVVMRKYITTEPSNIFGTEENNGVPVMDHFRVDGTGTQTAGEAQTITITAIGSYGDTFTDYSGSKDMIFSGATASGSYQPTCNDVNFGTTISLTFTDGVATCSLKLYKAETAQINATQGFYNASGHTLSVVVSPSALNSFGITAPATAVAGTAFSLVLAAKDLYGNDTTNITNTTTLSVESGTISPDSISVMDFSSYAGPDSNLYSYEKDIALTNNVASNLTGYPVKLTIDTAALIFAGKMQTDCDDMRFAETDNSNIPYWIESGCNTSSTIVWIKTNLASSAPKTIYFYYGNGSVISAADGSGVFSLFDDFSGSSLDAGKWTIKGVPILSGGAVTADKNNELISKTSFGNTFAIRTKVNHQDAANADAGFVQWSGSGTAGARSYKYSVYGSYPSTNLINAILNGGASGAFSMGNDGTAAHVYDLARSGSQCQMSTDNVLKGTLAGGDSGSEYLQIAGDGTLGNLGQILVDWVLVRQRVSTEPTVAIQITGSSANIVGAHTTNVTISGVAQPGNVILTVTNGSISQTQDIYIDQIDHFALSGTSTQNAGAAQTVTVTAIGASGNTFTYYTGSHNITFGGANPIGANVPTCSNGASVDVPFGSATALIFTNGVANCALKLYKAETAAIDATDGIFSAAGHTLSVAVSAGAMSSLSLSASENAVVGVISAATLTAGDNYGNPIVSYNGEHNITFSGANVIGVHAPSCTNKTGADINFGTAALMEFASGVAATDLKFYRAETAAVVASDGTFSATKSITVSASGLYNFIVTSPASAVSGVPFAMSLSARDIYGNTAVVSGDTTLSSSHGTISPATIASTNFANFLGPDSVPYSYRKNVTIANNVASNLTNYQVKLTVDTAALIAAGRIQSDCDDLRFAETDNANISYWIESGCNTSSTNIWIKTDLTASASKSIYMYYGNGAASSASSAKNVFDIGDDFDDGVLDSSWTFDKGIVGNSSTESVGALRLQYALNSYAHLQRAGMPANFVAETKIKRTLGGGDYSWAPGIGVWFNSLDNIQGLFGGTGTMKYIGNQVTNGSAGGGVAGTLVYGTDYYFRIVVTSGNYYVYGSADNVNWTAVTSGSRPAGWTIDASSVLILGSGYEATGYANADFDNNYSSTGANVDAYYDWVRVRKYAATEPTVTVATSTASGTFEANFTIGDVTQPGTDTITIQSGSLIQTQDIFIDQVDHFNISGISTQAAGSSQQITVAAVGTSGSTFGGYAGDKSITFSGANSIGSYIPTCTNKAGADIQLGSATTLNFVNGIATCNLKLYKAETAVINATDGSYNSNGHTLSIAVSSTASSYAIDISASITAGISATVTLTAGDIYGNPATTYVGDHDITFSGANVIGSYHPTCTNKGGVAIAFGSATSLTFTSGVAHCDMLLYKEEAVNISASDGTYSASRSVGVVAGTFHDFDISLPSDTTSGVPFSLGLIAKDQYGNDTTGVSNATNLSVNHGNINGSTISASQFFSYTGPDEQTYALRKNITLTNNVAQNISGYQIRLTIDTAALIAAGQMQSSCHDMRFAEMDGADIPYWIESGCDTATTYVWIKTDLPSMAAKTIYLYHGNGAAASQSSGSDVFDFYENFEDINVGELGSWVEEYSAGSFARGHHAFVVADSTTVSKAMETSMSGGGSGTYYTNHAVDIAAGDYTVDFGLYTNYGHTYDGNMHSTVKVNGTEKYNGLPTAGDVWEGRTFDLLGSGAGSSVAFGQWGSWSNADPVMRYDDVRIRKYLSSAPTVTIGASTSASSYTGNFTISGIVQQTVVTFSVQNGSSTQTADINVAGVDQMDHFLIEGVDAQTAGTTQDVTITAIGASGNPYVLYAGSHDITFGGANTIGAYIPNCSDAAGNAVNFGSPTPLTFTNGIAHSNLRLYKTENVSIGASDGTYSAIGHTLGIDVAPAAVSSFDIVAPASATSEISFSLELTSKDLYGNLTTSVTDPITLSVNHGTIAANSIASVEFGTDGTYTGDFTISQIYANTAVTVTFQNGSISQTKSITVTGVDHMDHLTLSGSNTQLAGTSQSVTVIAVGLSGSAYPGYSGDKTVTFSGANSVGAYVPTCSDKSGTDIPFGNPLTLSFANGVATSTLKLYKTETPNVTVTEGSYSAVKSISVTPNVVSTIEVTAPGTATSEVAFSLSVLVKDAYGNITTNVNSNMTYAVNHGVISPTAISYTQFRDDGAYTRNFTISQIYTDTDVIVTVANGGVTQTKTLAVTGVNQMDHFVVTGTGTQIAGSSQTMTVTAINDSGSTDASYTGSKNMIFSGASAIGAYGPTCNDIPFGVATPITFTDGVATCSMKLYRSGSSAIDASDGTYSASGHTQTVVVSPLAMSSFAITAPATVTSGSAFSMSLTAKDTYGNATTGVTETTAIAIDQGTINPSAVASASFLGSGSYTTNFTIGGIPENTTATMTFQNGSLIQSKSVNVIGVDETHHLMVTGGNVQTAGETQTITVTAIAISGNTDISYSGNHNITFSGANPIGAYIPTCNDISFGSTTALTFTSGVATCQMKLYRSGSANIYVSDGTYTSTGHTLGVSVSAAPVSGFIISAPATSVAGTPFSIAFTAKDAYSNTTRSVNDNTVITLDQGTITPSTVSSADFQGSGSYTNNFTIGGIDQDATVTLTFQNGSLSQTKTMSVHQVDRMDHFSVTGAGTQIAGNSQTITITAIGVSGNTFTAYTGSNDITLGGANGIGAYNPTCSDIPFGTATPLNFTNGVAHCTLKLYKGEAASIGADDGTYDATDHTLGVTVSPNIASEFLIENPSSITSGVSFPITFTAKDVFGNVTTNVGDDISVAVNHGNINTASIGKTGFQTNGIYTGNLTVSNILQSADVTITFRSGSITQAIILTTAGVDYMDHFALSGADNQAAGTAQLLTITAIGQSGNAYTAYDGNTINMLFSGASSIGAYTPSCTDKDGNEIPFGSSTPLIFTDGVATCNLMLYKSGASTVTASSTSYASTGHNLSVTVSPDVIYSFAGGVPTLAVSGQPFLLTLTAKDLYGNTTNEVSTPATLSVDSGTIDPLSVPAAEFQTDGTYTREVIISEIFVDTPTTLTIRNGAVTQTASLLVTGVDHMDHLRVTSASDTVSVGDVIRVDISIMKADGSVYTDYTGSKIITMTGAQTMGAHTATYTDKDNHIVNFNQSAVLTFINGVATSSLTFYKAAAENISAADSVHENNVPLSLTVDAGAVAAFDIETSSPITSGSSFPLALTARDEYGNITALVDADLVLTVSDGILDTTAIAAAGFQTNGTYIATITISDISSDKDIVLNLASGPITQSKTLSIKGLASGGSGFVPPAKPDISKTKIILVGGRLVLIDIPRYAFQIAVSTTSDFGNISWEDIGSADEILNRYGLADKLFIEFRTRQGGVSDVLIYESISSATGTGLILDDGDIVKTADSFDVYIIKIKNGKLFKRLILSPEVFNSYQHLKWENIKIVSASDLDLYTLSDLVQVAGDTNIYELFPDGDQGTKRTLDPSRPYDVDSVYEINSVDRDSYRLID